MARVATLLSAGHETTTNLIGNRMLTLLEYTEQRETLRSDLAVMVCAVEELLRFCGPVGMSTHRDARQPVDVAGTRIPQGAGRLPVEHAGPRA